MVTITVVEPNTLLRLGILNLLKTLDCRAASQGIDYTQLFDGGQPHPSGTDLMLLSVPAAYDHVKELVTTAQQRVAPRRILLLSDAQEPSYSLLNLPSVLAGYVCKFASPDVLKSSIMLSLAGGKCFPRPSAAHAGTPDMSATHGDDAPKRRWYDQDDAHPQGQADGDLTNPLPSSAQAIHGRQEDGLARLSTVSGGLATAVQALTPELIQREAELLRLTPRQYGILALMARGYPLKQISRELAISVATVKTHTEALYLRLGVNNRNAAVYAAVSRGATLGCWKDPQNTVAPPPAA
ncbi:response regulator transcription factor [Castellaniella sp.]|uniref:response regulator transcription factor n=1 Tax=Castellaniella sp. TaxID=1955812 RepID=UPI002AFE8F3B|nr:LuxR C-terminal-related transcriptional regulator [Castellaniella sp.]